MRIGMPIKGVWISAECLLALALGEKEVLFKTADPNFTNIKMIGMDSRTVIRNIAKYGNFVWESTYECRFEMIPKETKE